MLQSEDKRIKMSAVTRVHWLWFTNVASELTKNLYSNVKYQYDIFSIIHNFVNFYWMHNKTSKTSKWLWCSVATGSIRKRYKLGIKWPMILFSKTNSFLLLTLASTHHPQCLQWSLLPHLLRPPIGEDIGYVNALYSFSLRTGIKWDTNPKIDFVRWHFEESMFKCKLTCGLIQWNFYM